MLQGTTAAVTLPEQELLAQFPAVELDFSLECPTGNLDSACSVWDRIVDVTASCRRGTGTVLAFELGRWINAFERRVGHWVTRTPVLSGLGGAACNFTFAVGLNNPWRATLNLRFVVANEEALPPPWLVHALQGGVVSSR